MWSDNETTIDLIGFRVHADLVRSVVTDPSLLPVVLGVFGDWGGGKSSIMRMLEEDLNTPKHENVVCLYFNGWMFEDYEDAKSALLSSILIELGENKRFGPKVKDKVVGLLKRVKWMEVAKLGVRHVGMPLVAGLMTGGVATLPTLAASFMPSSQTTPPEGKKDTDGTEINWSNLIREKPGSPELLEVRKFREDFEKMLAETNIESLVILIDDLDRCLPPRIIETLEAIKLFVLVPRTAFVIGADPRIVRHAIATRYVKQQIGEADATRQEEYDLVKDYLEKLIQIPYQLPRLSPAEIETYINLLACQKCLTEDQHNRVLADWSAKKTRNFYAAYQHVAIKAALGDEPLIAELEQQLSWSSEIAQVVTEGLKGNPRQVKRMLNAMLLRKKLANVAGISIKDDVLAKLMVLEYTNVKRFQDLNTWQASEDGLPSALKKLEENALGIENAVTISAEDKLGEWQTPTIKKWLQMQPSLREIDLRDYFWLFRDRTTSSLIGVSLTSPLVRRLFESLIAGNDGERHIATREAENLLDSEREELLGLLKQKVERHPDEIEGFEALSMLAEKRIVGAGRTMLDGVQKVQPSRLPPGVAYKISTLGAQDEILKSEAQTWLENLDEKTAVGKAAKKALRH
jgi:hypothetical protein